METALVPITGRLAPPWHWILPHLASLQKEAKTGENSNAVIESCHFSKCVDKTCSSFFCATLGIQRERIAREEACLCVSMAIAPDIFHHTGGLQDIITFQTAYLDDVLFCWLIFKWFFLCFFYFFIFFQNKILAEANIGTSHRPRKLMYRCRVTPNEFPNFKYVDVTHLAYVFADELTESS